MRQPDRQALEQQCTDFNARFPIGTGVVVRRDCGEGVLTETRSKAEVLSGHTAVIWLEGISGCYELSRVTPLVSAEAV